MLLGSPPYGGPWQAMRRWIKVCWPSDHGHEVGDALDKQ
jgi:hypothetical protein